MTIDAASATAHLCTVTSRYLRHAPVVPEGRAGHIEETRELLERCAERLAKQDPEPDAAFPPVANAEPGLPVLRRHARSLALVAAWSPFYKESAWSRPFLEGFAVGALLGPRGSFQFPGLIVDLFLYGPGVDYPLHAHPAKEVYLPLSGNGDFQIGSSGRRLRVAPGTAVIHESDEAHGVIVGKTPLFGLAILRGDLDGPTWYRTPMADDSQPKSFPPLL